VSRWYCRWSWWGLGSERGLAWEFLWFVFWKINCKHYGYLFCFAFRKLWNIGLFLVFNKVLNFPVLYGKWSIINCDV